MKRIITAVAVFICVLSVSATRYVGGDISLLPEYEATGAIYKTHDGRPVADLLPWLHDQGMNAMRVRLFVNPDLYARTHADNTDPDLCPDPNACQDLEYIIPLCRRIVDDGFSLMLDFHYSDTWADPAKQWTPIEWEGMDDEALRTAIYDYTRSILETLRDNGIVPAFIQTGNEISYGMMWGPVGSTQDKIYPSSTDGWDRFTALLREAGRACREVCPDAAIVIHTERSGSKTELVQIYDRIRRAGIDYDIIGLSYYPYFHGGLELLDDSLTTLERQFADKEVMIVETGYAYKWEVPGTIHDFSDKWAYSDAGQDAFARDLVSTLERHDNVNGLFWWWMEYNAFGTTLSGWYNAPLFDSTTGRATSALKTICSFADGSDVPFLSADSDSPIATPIPEGLFLYVSSDIYTLTGQLLTHAFPGCVHLPSGLYLVRSSSGNARFLIP